MRLPSTTMSLSKRLFGSTVFQGSLTPLQVPVVCAPLASASGGALAAAVARAGGLGFCGAGYWTAARVRLELDIAAAALDLPRPVPGERRPVGIGLLVWKLTEQAGGHLPRPSDPPHTSPGHALVHALAAEQAGIAWLSFGTPKDLHAWTAYLRYWDDQLRPPHTEPIRIVIGAGTLHQAQAALALRPDALSLTGFEGGGHGLEASPPVRVLLAEVRAAMPADGPLLFAAGGLADGREARQLLDAGADAAVFGTRFLLTPESLYSDAQKDMLIRAGSAAPGRQGGDRSEPTIRSTAFDEARGTTGWPDGVIGRGLHSRTIAEYHAGNDTFRTAYSPVQLDRVVTWAGTGVVRINDLLPTEQLTLRLAGEMNRAPTSRL